MKRVVKTRGKVCKEILQVLQDIGSIGMAKCLLEQAKRSHWNIKRGDIPLACVTEQTHEIHVYGLCDSARFAVPHNFASINHEPKHSAHIHRLYMLFAPCIMFISRRAFFMPQSSFVSEVVCSTVLTDLCVFATVQIYH